MLPSVPLRRWRTLGVLGAREPCWGLSGPREPFGEFFFLQRHSCFVANRSLHPAAEERTVQERELCRTRHCTSCNTPIQLQRTVKFWYLSNGPDDIRICIEDRHLQHVTNADVDVNYHDDFNCSSQRRKERYEEEAKIE
jgi:hypothetical protein